MYTDDTQTTTVTYRVVVTKLNAPYSVGNRIYGYLKGRKTADRCYVKSIRVESNTHTTPSFDVIVPKSYAITPSDNSVEPIIETKQDGIYSTYTLANISEFTITSPDPVSANHIKDKIDDHNNELFEHAMSIASGNVNSKIDPHKFTKKISNLETYIHSESAVAYFRSDDQIDHQPHITIDPGTSTMTLTIILVYTEKQESNDEDAITTLENPDDASSTSGEDEKVDDEDVVREESEDKNDV